MTKNELLRGEGADYKFQKVIERDSILSKSNNGSEKNKKVNKRGSSKVVTETHEELCPNKDEFQRSHTVMS
jgi:hypothetical protein